MATVNNGTNINIGGPVANPTVNLNAPLTSTLNMGAQSLTDSAGAVGAIGEVLTCGAAGGQTLWGALPAGAPVLTSTNANVTYYPTFVTAGGGVPRPLFCDDLVTPFSVNPNNGDFNVADTVIITQSQLAIGKTAGTVAQSVGAVAIGLGAANNNQGQDAISIGSNAGNTTQGGGAVAIGAGAANNNQGVGGIAIGNAASTGAFQGASAIAIGVSSCGDPLTSQGNGAIAIGSQAGFTSQGAAAVAIGEDAGYGTQSQGAVAIGDAAGNTTQGQDAVAIGTSAGLTNQGQDAVAIGTNAGLTNQGANAIAIGENAATLNQNANSICINATGVAVQAPTASLYVAPIINSGAIANPVPVATNFLLYNPATTEITYGDGAGIGGGGGGASVNVINCVPWGYELTTNGSLLPIKSATSAEFMLGNFSTTVSNLYDITGVAPNTVPPFYGDAVFCTCFVNLVIPETSFTPTLPFSAGGNGNILNEDGGTAAIPPFQNGAPTQILWRLGYTISTGGGPPSAFQDLATPTFASSPVLNFPELALVFLPIGNKFHSSVSMTGLLDVSGMLPADIISFELQAYTNVTGTQIDTTTATGGTTGSINLMCRPVRNP